MFLEPRGIPSSMTMVRCHECSRLLDIDTLKLGCCKCGSRKMKGTSYLGLVERIKIRFFKFNPVLVGGVDVPYDSEQLQPVRM